MVKQEELSFHRFCTLPRKDFLLPADVSIKAGLGEDNDDAMMDQIVASNNRQYVSTALKPYPHLAINYKEKL